VAWCPGDEIDETHKLPTYIHAHMNACGISHRKLTNIFMYTLHQELTNIFMYTLHQELTNIFMYTLHQELTNIFMYTLHHTWV